MTNFKPETRVRIKAAKPLPSGKTVHLVGTVWYVENGVHMICIITPGLYSGGILRLRADEIEAI